MPLKDIAWTGPRPLEDGEALVGRERELREIDDACSTHHVILLTAASGVGKTSFVRAGLIPRLRAGDRTFVPDIVRWPQATSDAGLANLKLEAPDAAERLYRVVLGTDPDGTEPLDAVISELAGDRAVVVVLDQFEELLRYQPNLAGALLRLVGRTARDLDCAHIVIARSEFSDGLRAAEVRQALVWPLRLSELSKDALAGLLEHPIVPDDVTVEAAARQQLLEWWEASRKHVASQQLHRIGAEGTAPIGLLHFQALLWSFHQWAVARDLGDQIRKRALSEYVRERARELGNDPNEPESWLLQDAVVGYVGEQTRLLTDQLVAPGAGAEPIAWPNGPRLMVARIAPSLTASGFKQPQTLYSMLPYALGEELKTQPASELAERLQGTTRPQRDRALAQFDDPDDGKIEPAGRARKEAWRGGAVVGEMIKCLHAGLHALSDPRVNVLREFDRPDEPIYELVHDGMGAALKSWASDFLASPLADIGVIAKQRGRAVIGTQFNHEMIERTDLREWGTVERYENADGEPMVKVYGIGWPGSVIMTEFTNIHFVECDFAGASFIKADLGNVVFERCNMTATLLRECVMKGVTIIGDPGADEGANLLTIKGPLDVTSVRLERLPRTTGLFLQELTTGEWTISDSEINHLVIEADEPVEVRFENTSASAVSTSPAVTLVKDDPGRVLEVQLA